MAAAASPLYNPLTTNPQQIRLVSLLPGSSDDTVSCELTTVELSNSPEYRALSYVWGTLSTLQEQYSINLGGTSFPVTFNLLSALRRLRNKQTTQLWVDSLCINQADAKERSQQVSIMRDIYASAKQVVIWLGDSDDRSDAAFNALGGNVVDEKTRTQSLRANSSFFFDLDSRYPWFSRTWILQELAVSPQDPLLVCGSKSAPWSVFVKAWDEIANEAFGEMGMTFRAGPSGGDTSTQNSQDESKKTRPMTKLDVLNDLRQAVQSEGGHSLRKLLLVSRTSHATDPRDRIYGLLGLMGKDDLSEASIPLPTDYQKSVKEVYVDAMSHLFSRGEGLYALSYGFLPGLAAPIPTVPRSLSSSQATDTILPSWVLDFTRQTAENARNPSSVLFQPPAGVCAGASGAGAGAVNGVVADDGVTVKVAGFRVDEIDLVESMGSDIPTMIEILPRINALASEAKTRPTSTYSSVPEVASLMQTFKDEEPLWRTLVSNKKYGSGYEVAPASYQESFTELLHQNVQSPSVPGGTRTRERSEFEQCLAQGIGKRSFLVSKSGFVGTCVPEARAGDVLAVLIGSPIPFVLRPRGQRKMADGLQETWGILGVSYLGGIMDGEIVDELYCEDLIDCENFHLI